MGEGAEWRREGLYNSHQKTHGTEAGDEVEVSYSWHPWVERTVWVHEVVERGRLPRRTGTGRRRKALLGQRDQLLLAYPLAPPRQRRAVERRFVLKEFLAVMDGTGFARTLTFRLTVACDRVSGL
jgi:hypothetical protein